MRLTFRMINELTVRSSLSDTIVQHSFLIGLLSFSGGWGPSLHDGRPHRMEGPC